MVDVLFKAGDHEPEIFSNDIAGKAAKAAPEQMGATGLKVGVTTGLTVIVRFVLVAHCPPAGVNV